MPPGFSSSDFYYLMPELVITAGALLVLALDVLLPRAWERVLSWVTVAVILGAGLALVPSAGQNLTIARDLVAIDGFATFFKVLFLVAAALTVLMSPRYLTLENVHPGEYYFLVLCATLGMMFMAGGVDLITLFIGLETMAVSFYVLTGIIRPNKRSNEAAIKYFVLGAFSLGLLLPFAVMLLVAGIGFKIAAVPFHMWAPDVYEGAPTPITAFLSVGSKAASFAMLLRIFFEGLPSMATDWKMLFYVLSVLTMTLGNVAALTQTNIKRMLAYSSIAHAGYILIGVIAGTTRGITAALIYMLIYAFMQIGAFAIVVLMRRVDTIGDDIKDLSGLIRRAPVAAVAMLLFMLSLGGIPPTAGFMGKFWIFSAAIESDYVWLAVIGVLNSAVSLYYYLRIVVFMFMKSEVTGSDPVMTPAMAAALTVAIIGTLVIGVYPRPLFEIAEMSARTLGVVGISATPF